MGVTNLQIGDRITITANGLPSTGMQLQDSLGNIVLQFGAMSSTPQTRQFTVSNAAESTLYGYSTLISVSGPYRVVVVGELHRSVAVQRFAGARERLPCGAHQRHPAQRAGLDEPAQPLDGPGRAADDGDGRQRDERRQCR
jgi:hypothetical protein